MSNANCSVCKGTGVYVPGNLKTCPSCHPDNEQETICDRDVRAVVVALIGLAKHTPGFTWADLVTHSEAIALEMQKQRKARKASNNE